MTRNHTRIHPTVWLFFGCHLTVLWGCTKSQTDIGLGLRPPTDSLQVRVIDTATVVFQTIREDSLETDELSTGLLGQVHLPGFSHITAGLLTQLRLSATDINFGVNPVADSMFLQLRYTGDAYGQLLPQHLSVQPLVDSLSRDSAYYSNLMMETTGEEWVADGTGPWVFEPTSNLYIGNDTLAPQLRLPLSLDAAQSILDLDSASFDDNAAWFDVVPGIAIQHAGGGHGIAALDINSGLSVMRMHYHNDSDTAFYDFLISPLSARVNVFNHHFTQDLAGFNNPEVKELDGAERSHVLAASGCKTRVTFPHLTSLVDSAGQSPTILKAELTVPVESEWGMKPGNPQDQLFVFLEREDGTFGSTPDQNAPIPIGGEYDAALNAYVFNITSTVHRFVQGDWFGRNLYLVSSKAGISVAGVVLHGPGHDNPAKLTITLGT